jgi:hypothetical protein
VIHPSRVLTELNSLAAHCQDCSPVPSGPSSSTVGTSLCVNPTGIQRCCDSDPLTRPVQVTLCQLGREDGSLSLLLPGRSGSSRLSIPSGVVSSCAASDRGTASPVWNKSGNVPCHGMSSSRVESPPQLESVVPVAVQDPAPPVPTTAPNWLILRSFGNVFWSILSAVPGPFPGLHTWTRWSTVTDHPHGLGDSGTTPKRRQ